ncbi:MAG TPA: hypothetical protein VMV92_17745 [Streptosporangiaceae bacterium]|nr:hypothetical protein [Streptosporangiaceae bacterium]
MPRAGKHGAGEHGAGEHGAGEHGAGKHGAGEHGAGEHGAGEHGDSKPGDPVRIAMWSGPRTVSTALMRSWANRPDTVVVDEPLYAYYLSRTGIEHPGREEILRSQPADWRTVVGSLTSAPLPDGRTVCYQKHMTHHLLPEVDRGTLGPLRHAFLIRDPAELLASYARVRATPTLDDLGIWQQAEIFATFGGPVVDSRDLLEHPEGVLRALCAALGVPFSPAMLSWPAGPRDSDGVWAPHWYESVWRSTGFGPYQPPDRALPPPLAALAGQCQPFYQRLRACRLTVDAQPQAPRSPVPPPPAATQPPVPPPPHAVRALPPDGRPVGPRPAGDA